jgi:prepilin-type N-terminal cleavage/methylation domain-containing protein
MKNKSGFTLIEILVVLGVIGLLAGILVPAVSAGMSKARRAQCLGNLRTIGAAFSAYGADHKGKMPSVGGNGADYATMSEMVQGLFEDGYLETLESWRCPTDGERTPCRGADADSFRTGANCSYAYFEGYNPLKIGGSLNEMPLACDRARGGGKAMLGDSDNHGASCRNVLYLGGSAMTLKTADKANGVMKVELPEGVSLVE